MIAVRLRGTHRHDRGRTSQRWIIINDDYIDSPWRRLVDLMACSYCLEATFLSAPFSPLTYATPYYANG